MQEIINREKTKCKVCAIGAVFVMAVSRHNNLTLDEFIPSYYYADSFTDLKNGDASDVIMRQYLDMCFTDNQLNTLESMFEGGDMSMCGDFHALDEMAKNFLYYVPSAKKRMQLIMQNIIDNKGFFKPETLSY